MIHVRGLGISSTDSSGRFQVWAVPPGLYKVDLFCPRLGNFFGGINDSTEVQVNNGPVSAGILTLDLSKCTGNPLISRDVRLRGHWSIAFEDGFFTPCKVLDLPIAMEERGIGHNMPNLLTVDFVDTPEMKAFRLPDVQRRENGGFLYYVDWTGTLEGPGWFGHMGLAAYRLTITHVKVARDAAPGDCNE